MEASCGCRWGECLSSRTDVPPCLVLSFTSRFNKTFLKVPVRPIELALTAGHHHLAVLRTRTSRQEAVHASEGRGRQGGRGVGRGGMPAAQLRGFAAGRPKQFLGN